MPMTSIDEEMVVRRLASGRGEFADLFFEERLGSMLAFEGGKVDKIRQGIERGIGLRIIRDQRTLYAYSSEISSVAVDEMAESLIHAASAGTSPVSMSLRPLPVTQPIGSRA